MDEIFENWNETKGALLEGLDDKQKGVVEPLLENQKQYVMTENAAAGSTEAHDVAGFRKILVPMIRRVIPGTIAQELVGVQPMQGPVGLVYSLRYKYNEAVQHDPTRSPFGGYDISAGDEAFGNKANWAGSQPIRAFYSGQAGSSGQVAGASGLGYNNADPGDIVDGSGTAADGAAWPSSLDSTVHDTGVDAFGNPVDGSMRGGSGSYLEGSGGRSMSLEVISQAVEAGSRKLQAGWTIEAMQDLNAQHGLDLESEMTQALSAEIVQEIDAEIITDLLALAGTTATFDGASPSTFTTNYSPAYVGDRLANLGVMVNYVANEIGRRTRRGSGNFMVVSPMIVSVLQSASKSVFAPAVEGSFKGPNNTQLVGTLNGQIKVYSYLWNNTRSTDVNSGSVLGQGDGNDTILIGYKGGNGETDAGYFYCPYIPLMSSGVVVNPTTFQPVVSLMTRYGKATFTDATTSLANSADYYGKINVSSLSFQ